MPHISQLPIFSAKDELLKYFSKSPTCVVIGETASGKTTRIPEFLYEAGIGSSGCILCTQPRRVAAITVATFMAGEVFCFLSFSEHREEERNKICHVHVDF